jgi:hypothetical protein
MAPANSCHACGSGGKLLRCGQCKNVWFCNRECQIIARKELGHKGANCRAEGAQRLPSSAAPSQAFTPMDVVELCQSYQDVIDEADKAQMANTRLGPGVRVRVNPSSSKSGLCRSHNASSGSFLVLAPPWRGCATSISHSKTHLVHWQTAYVPADAAHRQSTCPGR